ncbi:MAG: uridine diphosphate-N-acetylglucosamine-binding protein YvcK [Candidatus Woesebacteria bacterium]
MINNQPSVVIMGGGTGTYTLLSALRDKPVHLTALLTMVDDGGSNRILRDEFGLLPTSGVRQAIVALSKNRSLLRELFMYRFHQGSGIAGMTFGNLFLAAVADIVGNQEKAIEQTCKLLSVKGEVLPISFDDVRLVAKYADGSEVTGEHLIDEPQHDGRMAIVDMWTTPKANITSKAKQAILNADYIIMGPGDFFTNTVPNLVVAGVCEAITESKGKLIFIENLMTKYGDTIGFTAKTFIEKLSHYIPKENIDTIIINADFEYPDEVLQKYREEGAEPVRDDLNELSLGSHTTIIRTDILSHEQEKQQASDVVARSVFRHDHLKLGNVLEKLII